MFKSKKHFRCFSLQPSQARSCETLIPFTESVSRNTGRNAHLRLVGNLKVQNCLFPQENGNKQDTHPTTTEHLEYLQETLCWFNYP